MTASFSGKEEVEVGFVPNLSVKQGLDHLAARLDPIIAATLAAEVGDHPWTVVLEILDRHKGFTTRRTYATGDLQAQLRVLTERLGGLGYPFNDPQRTVSTLGSELRIVRNQLAHMHTFTTDEAFRAHDFSVRLLTHFHDDGTDEAARLRREALAALAAAEGITERAAEQTAAPAPLPASGDDRNEDDSAETSDDEDVAPDPSVLVRDPSILGATRTPFEAWTIVPVGGVDVLDALPKKAAKEKVRSVAVEIAEYEGPIALDRLVQMTARSFGLYRVRATREKKLAYQVRQSGLYIDNDRFVWPSGIEPAGWTEFRPNDNTAHRPFTDISPIEIANAARFISNQHPGISDVELEAKVLETFGRKRRSAQIGTHLAKARLAADR